jgi:predicted MPP superfamily phosphohydrolase
MNGTLITNLAQRLQRLDHLGTLQALRPPRLRARLRRLIRHTAVRRTTATLAVILVAMAGAWLGIGLAATVHTSIGPADFSLSLRPSVSGDTVIDIRPLGTLGFNTHDGPVRLMVSFDGVHPELAKEIMDNPRWADRLPETIQHDLEDALRVLVIRSVLAAVAGAAVTGLIVFHSWRRALASGLTGLLGLAVIGALVATSVNPKAINEPRYTGLLTGVPSLIGSAQSIVTHFSEYSGQLSKLVTNISQLYQAGSTLPVYSPDPTTIRVLHVSDIHLNPVAWNVIRSLKDQFKIDLVIDTGDITDHGTKAENEFVKEIGRLGVPYVYVRGNHDSEVTQKAVAKQKNAIVLDGESATVKGLRIYGVGDPQFTPDKTVPIVSNEQMTQIGREYAAKIAPPEWPRTRSTTAPQRTPIDVVAVHEPPMARGFSGAVALALTGHTHSRATELERTGTRVMIQGSTGGAGLRGLEHEKPTPIQASVLYFSKTDHRLQAWDDISLGGLGEQSVQIQRHLEPDPDRRIVAEPATAPSPTPKPSPSVTPTLSPAPSPSKTPKRSRKEASADS